MNVTPLIDVLLVLIIIFLVITPSLSHGLNALVPQPADQTPAAPRDDIVVTVIGDRTVRLNQETVAIAALIQATAAYIYRLHASNQDFRHYARPLLMENKFRAVRYGLDGSLIDFGRQQEVPERDLIEEYLILIDREVDELGSRDAINGIRTILKTGTGADRQLKVFEESNGDLKAVVDYMAKETTEGLF